MNALLTRLFVTLASCCLLYTNAGADSKDFSTCEGLSGAEWGLCRAGVAAGCADGTGSASACDEIESTYTSFAGNPPPWIEPRVECPCNFSLIPKTTESWYSSGNGLINFGCPVSSDGVRFFQLDSPSGNTVSTWILTLSGGTTSDGIEYTDFCSVYSDEFLDFAENLTREEVDACVASGIDYGRALKAILGDVIDDKCTPTL